MQQKCPPKSRNWVRAYFNCPALVEPFKCVNNILLRNVEDKCCRVKKVRPEKAALTLRDWPLVGAPLAQKLFSSTSRPGFINGLLGLLSYSF